MKNLSLITIIAISTLVISACSKQNWYSAAQSAQTAHCMKQPISEYEDCQQPSSENYNSYETKRQKLIIENNGQ